MTNHDGISSELMVKLLGVTLYIGHPGGSNTQILAETDPKYGYYANDLVLCK